MMNDTYQSKTAKRTLEKIRRLEEEIAFSNPTKTAKLAKAIVRLKSSLSKEG